MVNVAILGGTGHVGRTVVEALKEHPSHFVIILGRKNDKVSQSQANAIEAADRSKTTKRFIASNWATPADPSKVDSILDRALGPRAI
ncbi:hypothetical protein HYQ45_018975 [Verticillium longisporum]|uniref:NAD-dependent epimerase/dehydratase domain-containing protein n=1 Tax=Verticillium longisporum TaxID=100787 RepID=A0A8I2ZDI9_VERLO|nr:hypothetical protein HYQ45_018975 [Verticillium longisporum]